MKAKEIVRHKIAHQVLKVDDRIATIEKKIANIRPVTIGGGGGGGTQVIVSETEPRNKEQGLLWLDTNV